MSQAAADQLTGEGHALFDQKQYAEAAANVTPRSGLPSASRASNSAW